MKIIICHQELTSILKPISGYLSWAVIFLFLLGSCQPQNNKADAESPDTALSGNPAYQEEQLPDLTALLDSVLVTGAVLLFDPQADIYYSNDFDWARTGQLPASTFKIAHSIIALETGVMAHDSVLIKWDGQPKWVKAWEQDLIFREAFKYSCLPCYQQIASEIGVERMVVWLSDLGYGDSFLPDTTNIDIFWVQGDWRITPFQQIDFLNRLHKSKLPISARTEALVKDFMLLEEYPEYAIRGKTGWSIVDDRNNGWFVGYLETRGKVFFFATNVEPKEGFDINDFSSVRKWVTRAALEKMNWL